MRLIYTAVWGSGVQGLLQKEEVQKLNTLTLV